MVTKPSNTSERVSTRATFLRTTAVGGAALVGGGVVVPTALGGHADAFSDADILNYALTLEYLEASFYTQALGGPGSPANGVPAARPRFRRAQIRNTLVLRAGGGRLRQTAPAYLTAIRNHEVAHVVFLRSQLGASAVEPCVFDFSSALRSPAAFLTTARLLENTGVMAYDGAIRYVEAGAAVQAGATIATVEARHASYLNLITGGAPFPSAFDDAKTPSQIFEAAKGFITSCPQPVIDLFAKFKANGA